MSRLDAQLEKNATVGESAGPTATEAWRFSLKDALAFLTVASAAAALAAAQGAGSLVLSIGLYLAWCNARGRMAAIQTRRWRPGVFSLAWLVLAASLFLPAAKGCNNATIPGWQTAYLCAMAEIEMVEKLAFSQDPPSLDDPWKAVSETGWLTLVNAANLLALLSPLLWWRIRDDKGQMLGAALAVCAAAAWVTPINEPGVLMGCYAWCAGLMLLTLSYRIGWRTFAAMAALAAGFVVK